MVTVALTSPLLSMVATFTAVIVVIVILYILSIVWVARDAYQRGTSWVWCLIALIPFLGVVAYCLLRPSLLQIDRDEQELEIALKQRQLMKYGECIGAASCDIRKGDYVHVHNLEALRGRGDLEGGDKA